MIRVLFDHFAVQLLMTQIRCVFLSFCNDFFDKIRLATKSVCHLTSMLYNWWQVEYDTFFYRAASTFRNFDCHVFRHTISMPLDQYAEERVESICSQRTSLPVEGRQDVFTRRRTCFLFLKYILPNGFNNFFVEFPDIFLF